MTAKLDFASKQRNQGKRGPGAVTRGKKQAPAELKKQGFQKAPGRGRAVSKASKPKAKSLLENGTAVRSAVEANSSPGEQWAHQ